MTGKYSKRYNIPIEILKMYEESRTYSYGHNNVFIAVIINNLFMMAHGDLQVTILYLLNHKKIN